MTLEWAKTHGTAQTGNLQSGRKFTWIHSSYKSSKKSATVSTGTGHRICFNSPQWRCRCRTAPVYALSVWKQKTLANVAATDARDWNLNAVVLPEAYLTGCQRTICGAQHSGTAEGQKWQLNFQISYNWLLEFLEMYSLYFLFSKTKKVKKKILLIPFGEWMAAV